MAKLKWSLIVFALAVFFLSPGSLTAEQNPYPLWTSEIDSKILYQKLCLDCHGENGSPPARVCGLLKPQPSDLSKETYQYGSSLAKVIQSISQGTGRGILRFNNRLSPEQIQAVAQYVLGLRSQGKASGTE